MRLIDADELRKQICKGFNQTKPDENPMVDLDECLADFISIIDEQPTAYDVDKVIEEIEEWTARINVINDNSGKVG